MKGTEKQITWAKEIQTNVISVINFAMDGAKAQAAGKPELAAQLSKVLAEYGTVLDKVQSFDGYAGDMIDVFKNVRSTGMNGTKEFRAAIRLSDPEHIFH